MDELDLKDLFNMFWTRKFEIILIVIIAIVIGFIYSYVLVKPEYKSTTSILLAKSNAAQSGDGTITSTEITLNQKLVSTYSDLIKTDKVLTQVINNLKIDKTVENLKKNIQVTAKDDTEIIAISVTDADSEMARKIANEAAQVFITQIAQQYYNMDNVYVVDEAKAESKPYNINHTKDLIIFAAAGFVIACIYVLIANMLDTTVKSKEDIEKKLGLTVLTSIPVCDFKKAKKELIAAREPKSPISELFRTLRTNIQFMNTKTGLKSLLVTSTSPSEGKSWVSSNLATTFAQAGKRVILVDCDMRKGRLFSVFSVPPAPGLSNYLSGVNSNGESGDEKIESYIRKTEVENLYLITAGSVPPNPSELLVAEKMAETMKKLEDMCDIVIYDGTPTNLVTDALIISRNVDSTIIVCAYKYTKIDDLERVKRDILNVGGKIAGVVINKMPIAQKEYYASYYYGSSTAVTTTHKKSTRNKVDFAARIRPENQEGSRLYNIEENKNSDE